MAAVRSARRRWVFSAALVALAAVGCGGEADDGGTVGADRSGPATSAAEGAASTEAAETTSAPDGLAIDPTDRLLSGLEAAREQVRDPANSSRVDEALAELKAATGVGWTPEMLAVLGASYCNDWDRPAGEEGLALSDAGREDWAEAVGRLLSLTAEQADAAVRSEAAVDFRVCQ